MGFARNRHWPACLLDSDWAAWYVASRSQYLGLVSVVLLLAIALRVMEEFGGGEVTVGMRVTALAVIFVIAGTRIYGRNPFSPS